MPGFGTSEITRMNAESLAAAMDVTFFEIDICKTVLSHFKDIGHNSNKVDIVFENAQARERTHILFDLANKHNGIVIGTGDLSEKALGWSAFGSDQISMYDVNAGIHKTLIKYVVSSLANYNMFAHEATLINSILETPISHELLPQKTTHSEQLTENEIGPFEINDFILFHFLRYGKPKDQLVELLTIAFSESLSKKSDKEAVEKFMVRL